MNPNLDLLHPYPFEKLRQLKQGVTPNQDKTHIALSIGEPKHQTPELIHQALNDHAEGIAKYPNTKGVPELRQAIADWISQRFNIAKSNIDADIGLLLYKTFFSSKCHPLGRTIKVAV